MKNDLKTQVLVFHSAVVILVVGILAGVKLLFPPASLLFLFTPVVIALFSRRYGIKYSIALVVLLALVLVLLNPLDAVNIICFIGPVGIILGEKRFLALSNAFRAGLAISATFFGAILWYNIIGRLIFNKEFIANIGSVVKKFYTEGQFSSTFKSLYAEMPENVLDEMIRNSVQLLPSMIFLFMLIFVLLNLFVYFGVSRITHKSESVEPFDLSLPKETLNLASVLLLGSLLVRAFNEPIGISLLQNCIFILMILFFIQGVVVVHSFLKVRKINRIGRFFIVIFALLFLQLFGLGVIGWLDLLINLRRRFGGQ